MVLNLSTNDRRASRFRPHPSQAGMSIIEVLIAMGLLAIITVGILPLFVKSVNDNLGGRRASTISALATTELETMMALPFNDPTLAVPSGQTELELFSYWDHVAEDYVDVADAVALDAAFRDPGIPMEYGRWMRITYHNYVPVAGGMEWSPDLDGSVTPQFKNINLRYQWRGVVNKEGHAVTVHAIRAF